MRSLNNTGVTVPGGFRWFCEDSKQWIPVAGSFNNYIEFIHNCKKHCQANNIPIGLNWEQNIQNQICATLDGDWCLENGRPIPPMGGFGFDIAAVIQGTRTLASWLIKGKGKKVEAIEAERRALICAGCPMNQPPVGCTGCTMSALKEAVNVVVGGAATAYDSQLQSCKVCGCSLRAKIHLPLDILRDNLTDAQMNALPQACWLK
jgi:hypothetical protein